MAKESRLAEIYRQELKKGGLFGSLISASGERIKEKTDIRRVLPQSGISGAVFEKMFGKSYKYGSSNKGSSGGSGASGGEVSKSLEEKLTRLGADGKIAAKNSVVLPAMARDMNLIRMNIQKMVKLSGGTPAIKSDMFFKRSGDREKQYEQQFEKTSLIPTPESGGGGILSGLGSIGGSLLSGLGSIGGGLLSVGGSILSGIGSLIGGVAGGIFSIISGALGGLGPLGIILGAAAGFMIYSIAKSINFEKMGADFQKIYTDVSTSIKSFFGIEGDKGLLTVFAEKLDKTFKTTMFTDTLDKMTKIMESSFNKITDVTIGSLNFISGALVALASDMKGHFLQFLDEYGAYMIAAAAGGGALALGGGAGLGKAAKGGAKALLGMSRFLIANPPLAVAAAALGVTAYGLSELAPTDQDRLTKHLPEERKKLQENLKKTGGMFGGELDPTQRAFAEKRLIELDEEEKALLAKAKELEKKREERRTDHFSRYVESNSIPKEIGKVEQARNARESRTEAAKTDSRRNDVAPTKVEKNSSSSGLDYKKLNKKQSEMASLIYNKFMEAGFTDAQATAAVVNAFAESSLNPTAKSPVTDKEESYGLFQMNTKGGLGTGHSPEKLMDPNYNIDLMIEAAKSKQGERFRATTSLDSAIAAFTKDLERPKNADAEALKRIALASSLTGSDTMIATSSAVTPSLSGSTAASSPKEQMPTINTGNALVDLFANYLNTQQETSAAPSIAQIIANSPAAKASQGGGNSGGELQQTYNKDIMKYLINYNLT